MKWFIAYVRSDEEDVHRSEVIDKHPLIWEQDTNWGAMGWSVTLISWQKLTEEDLVAFGLLKKQ